MSNARLWKQWRVVSSLLEDSRRYLVLAAPELNASGSLQQFDAYLNHNELRLAMEELAAIGSKEAPKAMFWRNLQLAAEAMELHAVASKFHQSFLATVSGKNDGG
jgi:hypothetical protein